MPSASGAAALWLGCGAVGEAAIGRVVVASNENGLGGVAGAGDAVAARGGFPETEQALRELPGLGAYTAAAVAAIAFGERAVVVDANVERVVARLFAMDEPLPAARKAIRVKADSITPDKRAGDFAQAMMDLGATICTPRDPRCLLCPIAGHCMARAESEPARYPVKAPRKARPVRQGTAFWIEQDEAVWLVRRAGTDMLGGMRALPDDGWSARCDGHGEPPQPGEWREAGGVRHGFTHFELDLTVRVWAEVPFAPAGEGEWWPVDELDRAGLPTLYAKAAQRALAVR